MIGVLLAGGIYLGVRTFPDRSTDALTTPNTSFEGLGRVRVEVLNASGVQGVARDAMHVLRERGFDVVYIGNADAFGADTTIILDRVGWEEAASAVRTVLGVGRTAAEPDTLNLVDVTVLLGLDWKPEGGDSVEMEADEAGR